MNWAPADFIRQAHAEALETVASNHYQVSRFTVFPFSSKELISRPRSLATSGI